MECSIQGNKGAVTIRFNLYGCSVCVVNAHLTPHDHLLKERIADYNTIVSSQSFTVGETTQIFLHEYVPYGLLLILVFFKPLTAAFNSFHLNVRQLCILDWRSQFSFS